MFLFAFFFFLQGPHAFLYPLRCTNAAIYLPALITFLCFAGLRLLLFLERFISFSLSLLHWKAALLMHTIFFSQLMSRWKTIDTEENDFQVQTDLTEGVPNKDERLFSFNLPET